MVELIELLSYIASGLGVLFVLLAVISKLYSLQTLGISTSYPYQFLSLPYLLLGISFLTGGIAGIWVDYFKYERTKKTETSIFNENLPSKPGFLTKASFL